MSSVIAPKTVVLTARAAQDLRDAALIGRNTPYLEITLGAEKVVTQHATASMNPVFDETFTFQLPGEQPDAPPPTLRVTAMNAARLLPDQTIGTGTVQLGKLYIEGSEEARVPLHDSTGKPAGVAYIGVRLVTPEEEMEIRELTKY